jgi:branched-chain amino acid transport system substrate-binding protein
MAKTLWAAAIVMTALGIASARAEVLIATAGPMTGQYAWFGEQYARGVEMAVDDINRAGGLLGEKVRLVVGDDGCDGEQAVAVAEKFSADGVAFVAGHFCSGSSIPASAVYQRTGILMISPSSTNPELTEAGRANVFRVCGRDDQQGAVAGDHIAEAWGDKRIAIIHDGSAYGLGLATETRKRLNERGVAEVMFEPYEPGLRDYLALISKLQAAEIDVLYVGGYSTEAALMLRQARLADYGVQLVSGDALATDEFWMITGPAGEGAHMTFFPDPRHNPEAEEVVKRFQEQYFEPVGYTLYAYGAVQVWAQAVEKAGTLELEAVIESLRSHPFDTVLGGLEFNEKGDVTTPGFVWYVWKNGEYVMAE